MKGLILLMGLVLLVVILAGASASAVSDSGTPSADSSVPGDHTTTCQTESSSSGPIGVTMYAVDDDSETHADTATVTLRARTGGGE